MTVILFFLSIIILCVLIWLNKKNKEQFKDKKKIKNNEYFKDKKNKKKNEENEEYNEEDNEGDVEVQPDNFEELSVNNLLEIYKIIDNNGVNKTLCDSDKSNVISKLQETDIEDEKFIKTINSLDAYDSLINKLKNIGKITYKPCDNKNKNKNKNKSKNKNKNDKQTNCDPVCNCITDVDMCKNYTFLKQLYNENLEETAIINNMKTGKYINPEITTWTQNTEPTVDELKDILPSIFFPVEKSDSMW